MRDLDRHQVERVAKRDAQLPHQDDAAGQPSPQQQQQNPASSHSDNHHRQQEILETGISQSSLDEIGKEEVKANNEKMEVHQHDGDQENGEQPVVQLKDVNVSHTDAPTSRGSSGSAIAPAESNESVGFFSFAGMAAWTSSAIALGGSLFAQDPRQQQHGWSITGKNEEQQQQQQQDGNTRQYGEPNRLDAENEPLVVNRRHTQQQYERSVVSDEQQEQHQQQQQRQGRDQMHINEQEEGQKQPRQQAERQQKDAQPVGQRHSADGQAGKEEIPDRPERQNAARKGSEKGNETASKGMRKCVN